MKTIIDNRKANFNYTILEKYNAGMVLTGNEVKSIIDGQLTFNDSYCMFINNELWLKEMHIAVYKFGTIQNPTRDRKLLLNRKELNKIREKIKEKGYTVIPTKVFFNDRGIIKMEIGLGKGKNTFDKRETIKKKDIERELKKSSPY
jgi:SsrA-binding protein